MRIEKLDYVAREGGIGLNIILISIVIVVHLNNFSLKCKQFSFTLIPKLFLTQKVLNKIFIILIIILFYHIYLITTTTTILFFFATCTLKRICISFVYTIDLIKRNIKICRLINSMIYTHLPSLPFILNNPYRDLALCPTLYQ